MSVLAKCPQCDHQFGVPDKYAGKRGKCPKCGHLFRAPTLEEDIADWGNEVEDVAPPVARPVAPLAATPQPPAETAPPVAQVAGRPKAPLPKVLSEVTPPVAPVAPEVVANAHLSDGDLPDLASLSEPAGPTSAAPPAAPLAQPAGDLPDLSSISVDPIPVAGPPGSVTKEPSTPAETIGPVIDTGAAVAAGPAKKRRASDVFDPQELAAKLGQTEANTAEKPPSPRPPQAPTKAAAPVERAAATKPAAGKPTARALPTPAKKPAAPTAKPSGAQRAKPLPTAAPLKTATPAAKPQAKKSVPAAKAPAPTPEPQAEEQPPSEAAALAAAIATESEVASRPVAARGGKKPAKTPWLLIGVGGALAAVVLLAVIGFAVSSLLGSGEPEVTTNNGQTEVPNDEIETVRDAEGGGGAASTVPGAELSLSQFESARQAVVRIEVLTSDSKEIGSGFLIEPQGWVATAYSLIQQGTSASVVTHRGRHLVEGTVAISPECDLAILKIEPSGDAASLTTLPLDTGSPPITKQTAYLFRDYFNSRHSSSRTVASESLFGNRLGGPLKPFLPERARSNELLSFIKIDGRVIGTAHGAPLLNAEGRVLGICVYLGESSRFSYAIHVKHLVELSGAAGSEVKPLTPDRIDQSERPERPGGVMDKDATDVNEAEASGSDSNGGTETGDPQVVEDKDPFDQPYEGPTEPSVPPGITAITPSPDDGGLANLEKITAEKLQETLEACEALSYVAGTDDDYAKMQDLAYLFAKAQEIADDESQPETRRNTLQAAVEQAANRLALADWVDVANINKLAGKTMGDRHGGTFFYGTMLGKLNDEGGKWTRNVFVMKVDETDRYVALPTNKEPSDLPRGSQWLVLGIHVPENKVIVNTPEGQLTAEWVEAKYVIGQRPE